MAHLMSMTGFGRGQSGGMIGKATVEVKSVNHRSLKSSYRMPPGYGSLESDLRPIIEQGLERGSVDVFIQIIPASSVPKILPPTDLIDIDRLAAYAQAAKTAAVELHLTQPESITPFLTMPGVVKELTVEPDLDAWRPILVEAGSKARKQLNDQRQKEGAALLTFFRSALKSMEAALKQVKDRAPLRLTDYHTQVRARVQMLLEQAAPGVTLNKDALEREVAMMADRMAIDEEVTRLTHHIKNFGKSLTDGGPAGKSLEFIAQEMLREANTIGSKSLDSALTDLVLQLKTDIEKIKEQVANIE
ncbi:MAG TPA: YicC/YloC family endoribonuclease [Planctomycetota bacterium]|nr:YicC/YloC family endoribonuclease [Planctomycetota bacterium]